MGYKISIIVPIYNVEKYIEKCIESLIDQSYSNFEAILIDDGSTDSSFAKAENAIKNDHRFKLFHTENKGVSHARNLGLDKSRGKYIVFVDPDDYVNEMYLEDFINDIPNDLNFVIIHNAYNSVCGLNKLKFNIENVIVDFKRNAFELFYFKSENLCGFLWHKFFIREIIENNNIRFDENKLLFEDEDFFYKYISYIDLWITSNKSNYYYVSRNDSALKKQWDLEHYLVQYDSLHDFFYTIETKKIISKKEYITLVTKYYNMYSYMFFLNHIHQKNGEFRINNMKKMRGFLIKYSHFHKNNNKRYNLILECIKYGQFNLASFLINRLLKK